MATYDFSGWATRNDVRCTDGRTIRKDAFKENNGQTVPLVWMHQHNDPSNVLGHALLENREEGVYAFCKFNDTEEGKRCKELVKHGDISSLSIYANQLRQNGGDVLHGAIREVSLVVAGANPKAFIDTVISHSDSNDEEAVIYFGENINVYLEHSDDSSKEMAKEEKEMPENKEKSVQDVLDSLTDEQKAVVYALIGQALGPEEDEKEEEEMKHNVFENDSTNESLQHNEVDEAAIFADAARYGSLKEATLAHGITNIDYLFPEAHDLTATPGFINNEPSEWVKVVLNGVKHSPFAKVKMMFANITADEARAKGYIKGNKKVSEVFPLLKREVGPTTIYKKQEFDRDDIIDITSFDVVNWVKGEMRMKLDEELARAILFGDGRQFGVDNDAINPSCIIPIAADTTGDFYAMATTINKNAGESDAHALVRTTVLGLVNYQGSGNLTMFTDPTTVAEMLLEEDAQGHRMYKNLGECATAMGIDRIVKVPANIIPSGIKALVVDLKDYNVGADRGGAVNMFDDFDIDYNKQKYLIETRCSGALTKPYTALVLKTAA